MARCESTEKGTRIPVTFFGLGGRVDLIHSLRDQPDYRQPAVVQLSKDDAGFAPG